MAAFEFFKQAVQQYPDRWESWIRYGDYLWHEGGAYVDDGRALAVQAFRRAIALDSLAHNEPWEHLAEHATITNDLDAFQDLPPQFRDPRMRVTLDMAAGTDLDSATWPALEEDYFPPIFGLLELQAMGAGMEGAERLAEILTRRAAEGDGNSAQVAGFFALNRGQPDRATDLLRVAESGGNQQPEMWIQAGLYWDAEPEEVRRVRDSLEVATRQISAEAVARGDQGDVEKLHQRCWLAVSDLGDAGGVDLEETVALARRADSLADNLRWARLPRVCARFLEALAAVQAGDPSAAARVAAADSAFGMGMPPRHRAIWGTLLADLYRGVGNPERSLGLLRRVWMNGGEEYVQFLAPRLLRRARLAAELGYRDEAIQSYQHYLWLRSDPEPVLADQVEAVRAELAELLEE